MSILSDQIAATLLPGMSIPEPLQLLFSWIEARGLFVDSHGRRVGFLYPEADLKARRGETSRPGGTLIEFAAQGNADLEFWFGHSRPEVLNRLCVFAQTGAEGSMAAFWLDSIGQQRIVHLGSGSGSTLVCVLADNAVDFLRLLAIGYDEICWGDSFSAPPNTGSGEDDVFVQPNLEFRDWVQRTFSVLIPNTASEIVRHPAKMGDVDSPDPFCRWVEESGA